MAEVVDYIARKLRDTERDHQTALSKAEDFAKRAEDQRAKAKELGIVLRHLKEWETEVGMGERIATHEGKPHAAGPSIRSLVRQYLQSHPTFTSGSLTDWVLSQFPEAKPDSVRAELSHCKKSGQVVADSGNSLRSMMTPTSTQMDAPARDDKADEEEVEDEPGPGFGRF